MQLTGHINEDLVMALYLGDLTGEEEQRLYRHVSDCKGCHREYNMYREVLTGVETLVKEMGGAGRAAILRATIKQMMRQKQIYYDLFHHPLVGPMWVAATDRGVCTVQFSDRTPFEIEEFLREKQPEGWITRDKAATAVVVNELREYFQGRLRRFSLAIDWRLVPTGFRRQVLEVVSKIPYGQVYTYGQVAKALGRPQAVRGVGQALKSNPIAIIVPCHRVISRGGKLGGFSAGVNIKRRLLELENAHWAKSNRQMDLFVPLTQ